MKIAFALVVGTALTAVVEYVWGRIVLQDMGLRAPDYWAWFFGTGLLVGWIFFCYLIRELRSS